jgi:hypothetical protein
MELQGMPSDENKDSNNVETKIISSGVFKMTVKLEV